MKVREFIAGDGGIGRLSHDLGVTPTAVEIGLLVEQATPLLGEQLRVLIAGWDELSVEVLATRADTGEPLVGVPVRVSLDVA